MKRRSYPLLSALVLSIGCNAETGNKPSSDEDTSVTETAIDSGQGGGEDTEELDEDTEEPDCNEDDTKLPCDTEEPDCEEEEEEEEEEDTDCNSSPQTTKVSPSSSLPTALPPSGSSGTLTSTSDSVPSGTIEDVNFSIDLDHTCTKDLSATLQSPSGTTVELFNLNTLPVCSSNLRNTYLDDEGGRLITQGSLPFTGNHRPTGRLSDFDGENAQGVWTLEILDNTIGDSGKLRSWSIDLTLK